jgi:hypothetical protein
MHAHLLHDVVLSQAALRAIGAARAFQPHALQLRTDRGHKLAKQRRHPGCSSGWRARAQQRDDRMMHYEAHRSRLLAFQRREQPGGHRTAERLALPELRNACRELHDQHHCLWRTRISAAIRQARSQQEHLPAQRHGLHTRHAEQAAVHLSVLQRGL